MSDGLNTDSECTQPVAIWCTKFSAEDVCGETEYVAYAVSHFETRYTPYIKAADVMALCEAVGRLPIDDDNECCIGCGVFIFTKGWEHRQNCPFSIAATIRKKLEKPHD